MKITTLLTAVPIAVLGVLPQANGATVTNCSGTTIRIVIHDRASAPNEKGMVLRDGMHGNLAGFGPDMVLKVFEVSLFDVLRLSVSGLEPDTDRWVVTSVDGHWSLKREERC